MNNNNQPNEAQQPIHATVAEKHSRFHVATDSKDSIFAGLFLIFSIAAVWLCFWGGFRSGFTIANWAFLILVTCYCKKSGGGTEHKAFPIFCGVSAFIMSTLFSIRLNNTINVVMLAGVIALDCAYFDGMWGLCRYKNTDIRIVYDIFNRLFKQTLTKILVPFTSIYGKNGQKRTAKGGKIALGVIVAIPIVILLSSLLRSDFAFNGLMNKILVDTGDIVWIFIIGLILFPFILSFVFSIRKNLDSGIAYINKDTHILDGTVVNTVLCAVSGLYIVYLISQLSYFFGAFSGLLPENFSYAEYARRGFFELCAISAINLFIVFISGSLTKRGENNRRSSLNKALSTFISVVTLIIITTVQAKIYMYIKEYGMTLNRIYAAIFMVMLAICFFAVIIRIFAEQFPYIKLLVCSAVIILTAVSIADINTVILKYNIAAYESGKLESFSAYDLRYSLSPSSIPEIAKYIDSENSEFKEEAIQSLKDEVYKYYYVDYDNKTYEKSSDILGINSFTLDEYREYKTISKNIDKLDLFIKEETPFYYDNTETDTIMLNCTNSDTFRFSDAFAEASECKLCKIETEHLRNEYSLKNAEDGYYRVLFLKDSQLVGFVSLRYDTICLNGCEDGFAPDTLFNVTERRDDYLALTVA